MKPVVSQPGREGTNQAGNEKQETENRKCKTGKLDRFHHVSGCLFPVFHFFALLLKTFPVRDYWPAKSQGSTRGET